jgi:hypothetical protein
LYPPTGFNSASCTPRGRGSSQTSGVRQATCHGLVRTPHILQLLDIISSPIVFRVQLHTSGPQMAASWCLATFVKTKPRHGESDDTPASIRATRTQAVPRSWNTATCGMRPEGSDSRTSSNSRLTRVAGVLVRCSCGCRAAVRRYLARGVAGGNGIQAAGSRGLATGVDKGVRCKDAQELRGLRGNGSALQVASGRLCYIRNWLPLPPLCSQYSWKWMRAPVPT